MGQIDSVPRPHKHANSMALYAQDALETNQPWLRWEFRMVNLSDPGSEKWFPCLSGNVVWYEAYEYRRKPLVVMINGIEVPKPLDLLPKQGDRFYYVDLMNCDSQASYDYWCEKSSWHLQAFKLGILHSTEEGARKHVQALLAPTRRSI